MPRRYRTPIDIGSQIGYWTVVGPATPVFEQITDRRRGRCVHHIVAVRQFKCRCRCGIERDVKASSLLKPKRGSRSCGCYQRERTGQTALRHGRSRTSEYLAWHSMKGRCYVPSTSHFEHYGGRGIQICDQWRHSFEAFLRDVGLKPTAKHSLDRIDVNGHYEPGNVRWATQQEQMLNTRRARKAS